MQETDETIRTSFRWSNERRRRMAHLIDRVVDRRVLRNVRVGLGNVGFRLVVVVVADEILDRIVREELLELLVELPGERLVVHQDQRGLLHPRDHIGHRKGLTGPRHAEEGLMFATFLEAGLQGINGRALVPGGLVWSFELKRWHEASYRLLLYHEGNQSWRVHHDRRLVDRDAG